MLSGIITLAAFVAFLGIAHWAFSKRNQERFRAAARTPLEDETEVRRDD